MSRNSASLDADSIVVLTAARKILPEESGMTFFLSLAAGFAITLPPVQAGLNYRFIVKTSPTGAGYVITSVNTSGSAANLIFGQVLTVDVNSATDPDFDVTANDVLTLVVNKAVIGDIVELWCDGTNWYHRSTCSVFDAITLA